MKAVRPIRSGLVSRAMATVMVAALTLAVSVSAHAAVMTYSITPSSFQRHVNFLAADEQGGRGLGTPGIARSAEYIANHLASAGLKPAGDNRTFFQSFDVALNPKMTDRCRLLAGGTYLLPEFETDFVPFGFSGTGPFEGDLVFCGYGINNEDKGHDDYAGIDVAGKVVLILRHEPPSWMAGDDFTPHAQFSNKVYNAKEKGAVAVLIVNRMQSNGRGGKIPKWRGGRGGGSADYGLPAMHISQTLANKLLDAGQLDGLQALQDQLDAGKNVSQELEHIRISGDSGLVRERTPTRNVLGMLKGQGPLAHEIVVIGAHYDHLGNAVSRADRRHSTEASGGIKQIHNGADDNASGTAGVIELARRLAAQQPLRRSVLFMAFSGEETGLLGSKHFVNHPTVKLENIVAMLNMDMIGRLANDNNTIQVFGTEAAEGFATMLDDLAKKHDFDLKGSASATGPSDHTSFYQKKIPSLHFFSGLHEDYHMPSDDADKVNSEKTVKFLAYIEDTARTIIDADDRPVYHYVAAPAQISGNRSRVRMGVMPSYADDGEGLLIDGVLKDGPAIKAGMKDGDTIVQIGDTKVKNIYDYMAALRNNEPGDEVMVQVRRDGNQVELKVVLGGG